MRSFLLRSIRCIHVFIRFRSVITYYLFITLMLSLQKFMTSMWVLNKKVFARIFQSTRPIYWVIQFHPCKWSLIKMISCLKTQLKKWFKEWTNIQSVLQSKSSLISSLNLTKRVKLIRIDAWLTFHKLLMTHSKYQSKMKTKSKKSSFLSIFTQTLFSSFLITSFLIFKQILQPRMYLIWRIMFKCLEKEFESLSLFFFEKEVRIMHWNF